MTEPATHWNYRVLAVPINEKISFGIYEVYYTEGTANAYSAEPMSVGYYDDSKDIIWDLNKMLLALGKPILWAGDKFPQEYAQELEDRSEEDRED